MEKKVILLTGASSGIGFNGSAGSSMVAWRGSENHFAIFAHKGKMIDENE